MGQYKQMLLCLDLEARHRKAFCELLHTCPDVRHLGAGGEAGSEVLEHAAMASLHLLAQLQNLRHQSVRFVFYHKEACGPLFREVNVIILRAPLARSHATRPTLLYVSPHGGTRQP